MNLLLNHSDHNRTACGTLSLAYAPSFITSQVKGGMKRIGKMLLQKCKVPKLEADKLLECVACSQKRRRFFRMPNLTSHVATTKDHPQRLFARSVTDCRNLHVSLFLSSPKERFFLAELAGQETLNPVELTLTHALPSCMDIPLSLKMLHQKDLFCLLSAYLQF